MGEASAEVVHLINLMADCVFCCLLFTVVAVMLVVGRITSADVAANGVVVSAAITFFLSSF